MARPALLFDLDGTIWDSYPVFASALESSAGADLAQTMQLLRQGKSIVQRCVELGVSKTDFVQALCKSASREMVYENVADALNALCGQGVKLGVFTSLPGWIATPLLRESTLMEIFGAVQHRGTAPAKPNPRGLIQALATLGVKPSSDVLYVGDLAKDAATAQRAGVSFAWASYGYGEEKPTYSHVTLVSPNEIRSL